MSAFALLVRTVCCKNSKKNILFIRFYFLYRKIHPVRNKMLFECMSAKWLRGDDLLVQTGVEVPLSRRLEDMIKACI